MLHLNQEGIFKKQSSVFPALGIELDSFSQKRRNKYYYFLCFISFYDRLKDAEMKGAQNSWAPDFYRGVNVGAGCC